VQARSLAPHDFAILVRSRADDVEEELAPAIVAPLIRQVTHPCAIDGAEMRQNSAG
jgi:hypothetical protein